jgi:hypothetical protein
VWDVTLPHHSSRVPVGNTWCLPTQAAAGPRADWRSATKSGHHRLCVASLCSFATHSGCISSCTIANSHSHNNSSSLWRLRKKIPRPYRYAHRMLHSRRSSFTCIKTSSLCSQQPVSGCSHSHSSATHRPMTGLTTQEHTSLQLSGNASGIYAPHEPVRCSV